MTAPAFLSAARRAFYESLVQVLNGIAGDDRFSLRWFASEDFQTLETAPRYYVEPGEWRINRQSRATARREETVRVVVEGRPETVDALRLAVVDASNFLDSLALKLVKAPEIVPGVFCLSAAAFSDAAPLYDPAAATEKTPYLFAGLQFVFYWIA